MSIARVNCWVSFRAVFNRYLSITALAFCFCTAAIVAQPGDDFLTYDNQPLGSPEKPLILRTYFPDPGLGREVLTHSQKVVSRLKLPALPKPDVTVPKESLVEISVENLFVVEDENVEAFLTFHCCPLNLS